MLPYNPVEVRAQTPTERLQAKREYLIKELAKVDAAIAALTDDPKLAQALDAVAVALQ